jgi:hypothetical protein
LGIVGLYSEIIVELVLTVALWILHHIAFYMDTILAEECATSILRVEMNEVRM